jgi:hypothetical protein
MIRANRNAHLDLAAFTELSQKENLSFEQAEEIVFANSKSLRSHADRTARRLGIDIPTGKPLLPAKTKK